jgi:hypothetical protein
MGLLPFLPYFSAGPLLMPMIRCHRDREQDQCAVSVENGAAYPHRSVFINHGMLIDSCPCACMDEPFPWAVAAILSHWMGWRWGHIETVVAASLVLMWLQPNPSGVGGQKREIVCAIARSWFTNACRWNK